MADNIEWLETLNHIDFLRDYGRHFSVNRMLSFDSVRTRLDRESSLSFLEFNYMVLQAYDFVELARRYGCRLQIGGADQWGNIVSGIDLGRRTDGLSLFGLTTPLLTTADGRKMGKTVGGAVWLDAEWCPPFQFWQYWRNTNDADVPRFLRIFTFLPLEEVGRLAKLAGAEINEAKKILANEVTALVHGREAAEQAAEAARKAFEEGVADSGLPTVGTDPGRTRRRNHGRPGLRPRGTGGFQQRCQAAGAGRGRTDRRRPCGRPEPAPHRQRPRIRFAASYRRAQAPRPALPPGLAVCHGFRCGKSEPASSVGGKKRGRKGTRAVSGWNSSSTSPSGPKM